MRLSDRTGCGHWLLACGWRDPLHACACLNGRMHDFTLRHLLSRQFCSPKTNGAASQQRAMANSVHACTALLSPAARVERVVVEM
jgi:hypothetical protein